MQYYNLNPTVAAIIGLPPHPQLFEREANGLMLGPGIGLGLRLELGLHHEDLVPFFSPWPGLWQGINYGLGPVDYAQNFNIILFPNSLIFCYYFSYCVYYSPNSTYYSQIFFIINDIIIIMIVTYLELYCNMTGAEI